MALIFSPNKGRTERKRFQKTTSFIGPSRRTSSEEQRLEIARIQEKHSLEIVRIQADSEAAIEKIRQEHNKEVTKLQQEHKKEIKKATAKKNDDKKA